MLLYSDFESWLGSVSSWVPAMIFQNCNNFLPPNTQFSFLWSCFTRGADSIKISNGVVVPGRLNRLRRMGVYHKQYCPGVTCVLFSADKNWYEIWEGTRVWYTTIWRDATFAGCRCISCPRTAENMSASYFPQDISHIFIHKKCVSSYSPESDRRGSELSNPQKRQNGNIPTYIISVTTTQNFVTTMKYVGTKNHRLINWGLASTLWGEFVL